MYIGTKADASLLVDFLALDDARLAPFHPPVAAKARSGRPGRAAKAQLLHPEEGSEQFLAVVARVSARWWALAVGLATIIGAFFELKGEIADERNRTAVLAAKIEELKNWIKEPGKFPGGAPAPTASATPDVEDGGLQVQEQGTVEPDSSIGGRGPGGGGAGGLQGNPVKPGQWLTPAQVRALVKSRTDDFNVCYKAALEKDPGAHGTVTISFSVTAAGNIKRANVSRSSLGNPVTEGCVLRTFNRLNFPVALNDTDGSLPLMFRGDVTIGANVATYRHNSLAEDNPFE